MHDVQRKRTESIHASLTTDWYITSRNPLICPCYQPFLSHGQPSPERVTAGPPVATTTTTILLQLQLLLLLLLLLLSTRSSTYLASPAPRLPDILKMANINDPLAPAIDTIKSANISANDRALLKTFILVSLNSSDAAQYVVDRVSRESATKCLEETLLSLKKDLEALASKSTLSSLKPPSQSRLLTVLQ